MTDFTNFRDRNRDQQDGIERGMWGLRTYVDGAGSHMSVRGTGTLDEEVPVINMGYSFNLPKDSNAEVVMLALGSDTNDKVALLTIARDLQYQWGEGQGGIQHPTDPNRRIEFNGDETWIKDGTYILGHDRAVKVTVSGQNVVIDMGGNSTLNIVGDASVNIQGSATVAVDGDATLQIDGDMTAAVGGDSSVTAGGTMALQSGGDMTLTAANVSIDSGNLTHNGTNIGDDHRHRGVDRGGSSTDGPS